MAQGSAEHVVVREASDRAPLAAHARNLRLRGLIVQVAVGAVLATVILVRLDSAAQALALIAVIAVGAAAYSMISRRAGRDGVARDGRWAKAFPAISVERDDTRRAHSSTSVVLTDDGVVARRRTSARFARATFATVVDVPWSAIERIEYSASRLGWWYPVISGPDVTIAAAGVAGGGFRRALEELGASVG